MLCICSLIHDHQTCVTIYICSWPASCVDIYDVVEFVHPRINPRIMNEHTGRSCVRGVVVVGVCLQARV